MDARQDDVRYDKQELDQKDPSPAEEESQKKYEIKIHVASDSMSAYIQVKFNGEENTITCDEIVSFLKENGIVYGILDAVIQDFCDNKKFFLQLLCARGLDPVDEEDAQIEYLFRKDQNFIPKERDDGTADYRDLGMVQNVKKGDILCRIHPAKPGKDGIDIYGNAVSYKKGRMPSFPSGSNTVVSEDGLTLSAAIDGCVEYKNAQLNINEMFVVRGDVDSATGNIDFLGSVTIYGDVLEGFSVKAGMSIFVNGMVEGAKLQAGEDIVISNGMNGMGRGTLNAGGNITGKYFENVTMECDGDVHANVIMNCRVQAGNAVILQGRKALLAGGSCTAGKQIYAGIIGSASNAKTQIIIDSEVLNKCMGNIPEEEKEESLQTKKQKLSTDIGRIDGQIAALDQVLNRNPNLLKAKTMKRALVSQKEKAETEIAELQEKIDSLDQMSESCVDFNVIGVKIIYAGTKLKIGAFTKNLADDYSNTKFYAGKDDIVAGPVLPSDKIGY